MRKKKPVFKSPASRLAPAVEDTIKDDLPALRQGIDALDDQIVDLLNQRAALAQRIGHIKARARQPAYVPERERQVLSRLVARSRGPLGEESLRLIYKEIISASLALESPLQVAFAGPEASLAHEVAKRHFGMSARLLAQPDVAQVFGEVQNERCAYGIVPVETSSEGLDHGTLDHFVTADVTVCAEVLLRRDYHLLTATGTLDRVSQVLAHAHEMVSCRGWLDRNLPGVPVNAVHSIAEAARMAHADPTAAVLSVSDVAGGIYGLRSAASKLKEGGADTARYWVIGHDEAPPSGKDRTSVLFAVKDRQGILYEGLQAFAEAKVNMTRIESRPVRRRHWDYLFFVDLEGHKQQTAMQRALEQLAERCVFLKVLGSYPEGRLAFRRAKDQGHATQL